MSRLFQSAPHWNRAKSALCLIGLIVLAAVGFHQDFSHHDRKTIDARIRSPEPDMGVDVSIFLFDMPRYERELLPAYRSFMERVDPKLLVSLIEQAVSITKAHQEVHDFLIHPSEVYQEYADIVTGKVYYNSTAEDAGEPPRRTSQADMRLLVERIVAPALLRLFCVPAAAGFKPEQDLSKPGLTKYVYEHSRWIEDHLTFAKEPSGYQPEITLGEWSRLFSKDEVRMFDHELSRMRRPLNPETAADFDNLRALVRAASETESLGLLLSVL